MRVVALLVLCAVGGTAFAQPGSTQPQPPVPGPSGPPPQPVDVTAGAPLPIPPPQPVVDPRTDAAWQLYHDAFAALLQGKQRRAAVLVAQLRRDHTGHPAEQLAARTSLGSGPSVVDQGSPTGPIVEQPSSGARAELALFQTIHGIVLGAELCGLAECDSAEAFILLSLVGGAAGAGASLAVKELTSGQRALLNSGTMWGAANAGLLLIAIEPDEPKAYLGGMIVGQLGGLAIGAAAYPLRPTAGQVGITNSGGQWGFALTGLTMLAIQPDISDKQIALTLLLAIDGGIAAGAAIAGKYPRISRGRGFVTDAGGIVGGVGGAGMGILVSGDADARATPGLAAAGAVVGLAAAAYLTRDWDDEKPDDTATPSPSGISNVQTLILPVQRGRGATAGIGFTW